MTNTTKNGKRLKKRKTFYLPPSLIAWLEERAAAENRSASNFLVQVLAREGYDPATGETQTGGR